MPNFLLLLVKNTLLHICEALDEFKHYTFLLATKSLFEEPSEQGGAWFAERVVRNTGSGQPKVGTSPIVQADQIVLRGTTAKKGCTNLQTKTCGHSGNLKINVIPEF